MQHADFLKVVELLELSQSIFVKQIRDLYAEIILEMEHTSDNLDNLQLLVEPCKEMQHVASPAVLPTKLKNIMHIMRVIWLTSKYFNTSEHMTNLFRTLSNQIIIYCQSKMDVQAILAGRPREGIKQANVTIDCCLAYRIIYDYVRDFHVLEGHPIGWHLDEAAIFNHVDAFVQRLHDFIEICNAMIVFGRCDETAKIPAPLFGGIRGAEFERTCATIESRFNGGLTEVQRVANNILDVHSSEWLDDVAKYRLLIRDLEEIVENLISNVFLSVCNVEEGLEALCSLFYFSARHNLRPAYIRKTNEVWQMLATEIEVTNKMLMEQVNNRPSWLPQYAGGAIILQTNLDRITRFKEMFDRAEWMPDISGSAQVIADYEQMRTNVPASIRRLHGQWLDTMDVNVSRKLDRTLMCRSVTRPGLLECNIDRGVLELCEEARYFEMLGLGVPVHVGQIYTKYNTIRLVYESVLCVVLEFNKIIGSLSAKERVLFKSLIHNCERRIMPGIYKLTWGGELIDAYIAECVKQTGQLQEFLDVYKKVNSSIVQICEKICDTPIIKISVSNSVPLNDLRDMVSTHRTRTIRQLLKLYNDIVDLIVVVYEGFEPHMEDVSYNYSLIA